MDQIKDTFLKLAHLLPDADVEMMINGSDSTTIGYQQRKLNKFSANQSQIAGFRIVRGGQQGYAFTENLSEEGLSRAFHDADENAKMLLDAKGPGTVFTLPTQQSVSPLKGLQEPDSSSIEDFKKIAERLEKDCLEKSPEVKQVPYSGLTKSDSWVRILNSRGLDQKYEAKNFMGYAYPQMEKEGSVKMHGHGVFARQLKDVDPVHIAEQAIEKTSRVLGATTLPTGKYPVLFDKEEASMLLHMIEDYFSAKKVDQGTSLFKGRLGEKIFSDLLTLEDNPFMVDEPGARPFDSEGIPSQTNLLIDQGVLKTFLTNLEYAEKMKLPHTASAVRSPISEMSLGSSTLVVKKGQTSREEMLNKFPRMVLITSFNAGLHSGFNSTSGNVSMPVEGFLVENGKIVRSFDHTVMSGNILNILKNIIAVGNEYGPSGGNCKVPDLLVSELDFAGGA